MILDCDDAMNGMVVGVGAEFEWGTWGWAWVEWRGEWESGGSGSIGVGGRVKGLGMDEWDGVHGNQLLLG